MTIPHIKQRHLALRRHPEARNGAPSPNALGRIPSPKAPRAGSPGRRAAGLSVTALLLVGVVGALTVDVTVSSPSPQCDSNYALTKLSDGDFVYFEVTSPTDASPTGDIFFVRTESDSTEEDFRVDRGSPGITGDSCTTAVQGTPIEIHEVGGDPEHLVYTSGGDGFFETVDGGITWATVTFAAGNMFPTPCGLGPSWVRADADSWAFLGGNTVAGQCRPHLRSTQDAGATWSSSAILLGTIQIGSTPNCCKLFTLSATEYLAYIGQNCALYFYDTVLDTAVIRGTSPTNTHKVQGQTLPDCTSGVVGASSIVQLNNGDIWVHVKGDGQSGGSQDSYLWLTTNDGVSWTFDRLTVNSYTTINTFLFTDGTNIVPVIHNGDTGFLEFGTYTIANGEFSGYQDSALDAEFSIAGKATGFNSVVMVANDGDNTEALGNAYIASITGIGGAAPGVNQIAVNDLTQADVDTTGTIIIAREDGGETIKTYNAGSLSEIGTFPTPDCGIYAGVSSIRTSRDWFTSFGACDGTGNVDFLHVKSESLDTPNFLEDCSTEFCKELNEEFALTSFGFAFNIPEDMHALGTVSAIPYSFERSTTSGLDNGYASWTFSTLNGQIGVISASYNDLAADRGDRAVIDVSPGSDIHAFCSWRNPDNDQDYIAGVSNGPTVFAEVSAEIRHRPPSNSDSVEVEADTLIQNSVPFGLAGSVGCAKHQAIVGTATAIYLVNITAEGGVTALGNVVWVEPRVAFTNNEAAISSNGNFSAWRDGGLIRVVHTQNHTTATSLAVPTGTWRGIEFDEKGGQLFVYTNDFITIYDVSPFTCRLDCSATNNEFGEPLPGTGQEDGDGDTDELAFLDSPYFWIVLWIAIVEVLIAALAWGTRAGFSGLVYLIGGMAVYIIGMLIDRIDGTVQVSPWPLVVIVAAAVGLAIANFRR